MSIGLRCHIQHRPIRECPLFAVASLLARTNLEPMVVHNTNDIRSLQCATSAAIIPSQLTRFAPEGVNDLPEKPLHGHALQLLVKARAHLEYNEWSAPLE